MCSCAQVGVLSGGAKDDRAPVVRASNPVAGATRVKPQRITLIFDEFIELVNPLETFRLEPADAKLSVQLNKKEIIVALNGTLKENTTYNLCIDGGVKDVTEGNDSIYRLAFSTGNFLDSLEQHYRIGNAYSKKSLAAVSLGLYDSLESSKPRYLTKSNQEGWASLDYLPQDSFYIKAFVDGNKNGTIEPFELQAGFFYPTIPKNDSLALLLSVPRNVKRATAFTLIPPGLLVGHVPEEIADNDLFINQKRVSMERIGRDSVVFSLSGMEAGPLIITSPYDTLNFLLKEKDRNAPFKAELASEVMGNPISLRWNGFLSDDVEPNKIHLVRPDSSEIMVDSFVVKNNHLLIYSRSWSKGKVTIRFDSEACSMRLGGVNQPQTLEGNYLAPSDLGTLMVQFPEELQGHLVLLEKQGKIVQSKQYGKQNASRKDVFRQLIPGEYQILIVEDINGNGYWDTFRPTTREPAEPLKRYTKIPKVRANWEVEAILE